MRRGKKSAWAGCGAGLFVLYGAAAVAAPPCDQFDPAAPAKTARITLDAGDVTDQSGDEMRSFVETGSLGRVEVAVVGTTPAGAVRAVSAAPESSRFSPYYGEELKGIAVAVSLRPGVRPARVVLKLRQVCAKHFRDTFLYY